MSDWAEEPAVAEWFDHVLAEMLPMLERSAVSLCLVPDEEHGHDDVKFWVELGASIMLDKPVLVIACGDRPLPRKLVGVADEVVRVPRIAGARPEELAPLRNALARIAKREGLG